MSPAEIALIARTVHRSPEVMVKVLPKGSAEMSAVRRHVDYIGRGGQLALESDEGERLEGRRLAEGLLEQWNLDLDEHRRSVQLIASRGRKPARLVHKLMLSMPAGTSPERVRRAARSFLAKEFGAIHRYAFVLHTDAPHPHVHVLLKAVSERGIRLRVNKRTLHRWRESFAEQLRAQGVEANATSRAVRGQSRQSKHDSIFRAARRGESTHVNRRLQAIAEELSSGRLRVESGRQQLLSTRRKVEAGWHALAHRVSKEGWPDLADDIRRYVEQMPLPRTEKEYLAHEWLAKRRSAQSIVTRSSREADLERHR
ncbi:relaxase/mobilization nuclease domain-containing protein [Steroidobacter sp. S1-65]|uniref:Relaxase/mobilization nuclease domain-containing protein n=1 Tax=Steroidobacter gossypii TaxID=2805490 RepID=A0ABS1WXU0_9GAMM|nr:relaxase/mobilization nuclease domain-containing protein [Steroidobacter gossypii]MBM0105778.1 relaxase/mobilization nuclease domain-containing protein [Steroidobacter gossypii]